MDTVAEEVSQATETLADIRNERGKTTRETGVALGVTQPRITQIEQKGTTDIEQMESLAKIYGVSFERVRNAARNTRAAYLNK